MKRRSFLTKIFSSELLLTIFTYGMLAGWIGMIAFIGPLPIVALWFAGLTLFCQVFGGIIASRLGYNRPE